MRLDKYVRVALNISRNDARQIIKKNRIKINGIINNSNDYFLKDDDLVLLDDKELIYKEFYYIMMNKPKGYICAKEDNYNSCVVDLIEGYDKKSMCIVGRLDIDTTGLLLITNDGILTHKLTSPKYNCEKIYKATTDTEFDESAINKFSDGVVIYETVDTPYKCKKAILEIDNNDKKIGYITITEGKYHQVKKMCKSVGNTVIDLKRLKEGSLLLDESLKEGEYRELTEEELKKLFEDVK